jgi:hypothetical protein
MRKIVKLTESDLTKIVKRVINERRYLMEDGAGGTSNPLDIYLPFMKKDGKEITAGPSVYNKAGYETTFSYLDGRPEVKKELAKNPKYLPYKLVSVDLSDAAGGGKLIPQGAQKFVVGNDGNVYLTGTLFVQSTANPKFGMQTSNQDIIKFSDTKTQTMGNVYIRKGKEYIPTQK